MRCLELLNRDVIPAMPEHDKKLGLIEPFHCPPGGNRLNGRAPAPVADLEALAALAA